jgi:hypothetical protein
MAQKVTVELVDDLDGTASEDISTVTFALDGVSYEIDLHHDNAGRLRNTLADFVTAGRRTGGRVKRAASVPHPGARATPDREQTRAVREWARQNGFEMSDRGRISATVLEAFETAHAAPSKPKAKRGKTKELAFSS